MNYDKTYSRTQNVFGEKPERILQKFFHLIPFGSLTLDIGAGQGRNSFFLAEKGFHVDAIDPSIVAVDYIADIARKKGFAVKAIKSGFAEFQPGNKKYGAVLIFGLIQILSRESIHALISKLREITESGGLIFITGFLTSEKSFKKYSGEWLKIGKNSFSRDDGNIRTFFDPGEIISLFSGFDIIHHWEGMGPEHRHGDGAPERHSLLEAVFQIR